MQLPWERVQLGVFSRAVDLVGIGRDGGPHVGARGLVAGPAAAGGITAQRHGKSEIAFTYDQSRLTAEDVLDAIRAKGIRMRDVRSEEADLEDVFLELTSSKTG